MQREYKGFPENLKAVTPDQNCYKKTHDNRRQPIPVLIKLMTSLLPKKLVKATTVSNGNPDEKIMNVASLIF